MSKYLESEIWKLSKPMEEKTYKKIRKFYVKIVERFIENAKYFKIALEKYKLFP